MRRKTGIPTRTAAKEGIQCVGVLSLPGHDERNLEFDSHHPGWWRGPVLSRKLQPTLDLGSAERSVLVH